MIGSMLKGETKRLTDKMYENEQKFPIQDSYYESIEKEKKNCQVISPGKNINTVI